MNSALFEQIRVGLGSEGLRITSKCCRSFHPVQTILEELDIFSPPSNRNHRECPNSGAPSHSVGMVKFVTLSRSGCLNFQPFIQGVLIHRQGNIDCGDKLFPIILNSFEKAFVQAQIYLAQWGAAFQHGSLDKGMCFFPIGQFKDQKRDIFGPRIFG